MERINEKARFDWKKKVEEVGLIFHTPNGQDYWDESAYYRLSSQEVDKLEIGTNELYKICLEAVQHVIDKNRFGELAIPEVAIPLIKKSWEEEPPSIYGRFDLAYDGKSEPKMLEFNADTPTALLEASVVQWYWLQEVFPSMDQFNSIHERLVAKWRELIPYIKGLRVYFSHIDDYEDMMTANYLRETAIQAGIETDSVLIQDIGWDKDLKQFVDKNDKIMETVFKLYPWEWMIAEDFSPHIIETSNQMQWIEPIWKMILSNKGILPILWELFPNHPNLLPSYFNEKRDLVEYVKKPLLSREGANITIATRTDKVKRGGDYGEEGFIFQKTAKLFNTSGKYAVVGSWVVDGESAGIGIRESDSLITDNLSRFVPHCFD